VTSDGARPTTGGGPATDDRVTYARGPDWRTAWQPMVDAVGTVFGPGDVVYGADRVEVGAIRRYVEPLELGSALHHDPDVARAHGHTDVIAPYTSVLTFSLPPLWSPGEPPVFTSAERDGQPARSPVAERRPAVQPFTSEYFATDMEMDFVRPVTVGERIGRRRRQLLVACVPKETSVGRGAFLTWESEIVDESGETVARIRTGVYSYVPRPPAGRP
jgi:hypothetical protein